MGPMNSASTPATSGWSMRSRKLGCQASSSPCQPKRWDSIVVPAGGSSWVAMAARRAPTVAAGSTDSHRRKPRVSKA